MTNSFRNQRDRKVPTDPLRDQFASNERIRSSTVRLINHDGENMGVRNTSEAISMAERQGLDLVVISPTAEPPVAKICDYNKFIYEQKQQKKENDKKLRESVIVDRKSVV